jgi:lipopolysaccharide transport system permease protein
MKASSSAAPAVELDVIHIRPSHGWMPIRFRELWSFRELLYFLIWRDVKVRYKQTALGASWAILQPLLTMVVFSVFFGGLGRVSSDGHPYPIFSFAGLLPWTLFSHGVTLASNSFVGSANLIKKVYFPRLLMPIASVLAAVVDFLVSFVVLLVLMGVYRTMPTWRMAAVFPLILLALGATLGLGMLFATLNVEYRDVRYVLPFFIQIGLFVTPVIYPSSEVLPRMAAKGIPTWLYGLNPMVGVIEGFRWAILGTNTAIRPLLWTSILVTTVLLVSGAFYVRRMERTFADVV